MPVHTHAFRFFRLSRKYKIKKKKIASWTLCWKYTHVQTNTFKMKISFSHFIIRFFFIWQRAFDGMRGELPSAVWRNDVLWKGPQGALAVLCTGVEYTTSLLQIFFFFYVYPFLKLFSYHRKIESFFFSSPPGLLTWLKFFFLSKYSY